MSMVVVNSVVTLQGVVSEIALVDVNEDKLQGEMMDLQHGQSFNQNVTIKASKGKSSHKYISALCVRARIVYGLFKSGQRS